MQSAYAWKAPYYAMIEKARTLRRLTAHEKNSISLAEKSLNEIHALTFSQFNELEKLCSRADRALQRRKNAKSA